MRFEYEQPLLGPQHKMNLSDWLCKTKAHKIPSFLWRYKWRVVFTQYYYSWRGWLRATISSFGSVKEVLEASLGYIVSFRLAAEWNMVKAGGARIFTLQYSKAFWHNDWISVISNSIVPLLHKASILSVGPYEQSWRRIAFYLVGTGTSVNPERRTAGANLTNAMIGLSKKSTSPTKTLDASAPVGIFLMKFMSTYWQII